MSASTILGVWWISRADGELMHGEYTFGYGGVGDAPDWDVAGLDVDFVDEPVLFIAERVVAPRKPVVRYERRELELPRPCEHEYDTVRGAEECVACGADRATVEAEL